MSESRISFDIDIICCVDMSQDKEEVNGQSFQEKILQFIQTSNIQFENMQQRISQLGEGMKKAANNNYITDN